jgi:hypothetical protein
MAHEREPFAHRCLAHAGISRMKCIWDINDARPVPADEDLEQNLVAHGPQFDAAHDPLMHQKESAERV